ncbi:hypothetical protein D0Y65_022780 [Glycine soja]|uniref:Uncharacterized protein n=1 Tax=Glycine soja TaxID=3848 RepID=A0A445IV93_GLYSO|nr:hypothetical protein D0Y65_022780 [Glycine soja]
MPRTTAKSFPSFGTQSLQIHDRSLEVGFAFGSVGNAWGRVFQNDGFHPYCKYGEVPCRKRERNRNSDAAKSSSSFVHSQRWIAINTHRSKNNLVLKGYISLQCLHELLGPGTRNGNQVVHQICFGQSNAAVNNGKSLAGLDVDGSGDDGGGGGYGGGGGRGSGHWC